ncbi:beta strand repeat-containing protein, partial [Flavobacterium aciduliphilum]
MMNDYKNWASGIVAKLKSGVGIKEASPPRYNSIVANTSWLVSILLYVVGVLRTPIDTSKRYSQQKSFSKKLAYLALLFIFTMNSGVYAQSVFTDGFETGNTDASTTISGWTNTTVTGSNWTANTSATTYNRTPRTGSWDVTLRYGRTAWLFKQVTLTGGASYSFSCYARQDGTTTSNASIKLAYGTTATAAGMTNTIVNTTGIGSSYVLITGNFTPATTGTYYVGILGTINSTPWYITLDDVSLTQLASPTISSFTPSTLCVQGGQTVTITGTNLTGASAVKFNGVNATSFNVVSATSITAVVPANVTDGTITVTNPAGTATSGSSYTAAPTPTVGVSSGSTICSGQSVSLTATGGSTYSWSPATGLSATNTASVTASPTTTTTYTVTGASAANCTATATVTITVNPTPTAISIAPPAGFCSGGVATLTATGGAFATSKFTDGFNALSTNFATSTVGTGTPTAALNTTYQSEGSGSVLFNTTSTSASVAYSLNSNVNLSGASSAQLTFSHQLSSEASYDYGYVEYSSNGGSTWTTFPTSSYAGSGTLKNSVVSFDSSSYSSWSGITTAFSNTFWKTETINIPVAALTSQFRIRFRYTTDSSTNYLGWLIDNVNISATSSQIVWSPSTNLYTNVEATTAYSGGTAATVYAKLTSSTTYTATAANGSCSSTATVTVTPNPLPTITADSAATICTGGSGATLTAAGGTSYTWSPSTGLNGTTGSSVIANPSDTTTYTITGTDANGCVNTATSTVSVNNSVVIGTQPANQVILQDTAASFSVTATGTGISYQWQVNDGGGWANIDGATNATYTIDSASASLNGYVYRCVVTGTCNTVISSSATLTVGSVSITTQPSNQVVCSDAGATFSVSTSGDVTSYQWQMSTNGTSWSDVTDATSASLVLSGLTSTDTGKQYRCVLNAGAVTSNAATLTVYNAIAIGTQPTNQTVCSNAASVTFTSAATGSGVAYQWQVSTNGTSWNNVPGATAAAYTINTPGVGLNNNQYRVIVSGTSPCSAVTSDVATLTVNQVVAITTQPTAVTQCAYVTTPAVFTVAATGTGIAYQWQYTTNGTTWNDMTGETASSLSIATPETYNGNSFRCVVSGTAPCTSVTSNAVVLTVTPSFGGTYTVGTGGNYATLTAAVAAYNAATCFTGNVVFNLTDANYSTSETFPIVINANANAGTNTLTIKPNTTATITGSSASAIVKLNGADNVIIDGSNNGSNDKSLTIENTNTGTSSIVLWIGSASATNGATNDTVKNIIAKGNGPATTLAAIMAGSGTTAGGVAEASNTNLTIQNNTVMKAQYGIGVAGNATYQTGTVISGNTVGSTTAAEYIGYRGIFISNVSAVSVANNNVFNVRTSSSINVSGIEVTAGVINGSINANTISNVKSTSTSGYGAYGINFSSATGTTGVLVSNNMISGLETANYSTTSTTWNAFGIRIAAAVPGLKIYHNTVNMYGTVGAGTSAGMSAAFCTAAAVTGLDVRNNIFNNAQKFGTTGSFAYNMYLTTGTTFSTINYNNYSGATTTSTTYRLGYSGSAAVLDLAAWKTYTTQDAQSLAVTPNFTSNSDLHLNVGTNTGLDNYGTALTDVTTDFDGNARSATPDMGADEFTTLTCASQTLTAGTASSTVAGFCNSTTGATLSATGYTIGVGTTYQWEMSTNGTSFTGQGTASANYANLSTGALSATTYYRLAVICDGGSTEYSNVLTITKYTAAVTTVSAGTTICAGQSVTLTADGSSTYAWSPATGLNGTTGASVIATPSTTTTYTVTGTDSNGCATTATATVTVNAYPSTVSITNGASSLCANTVMSLTATGGTVGGTGTATLGAGASTSTSAGVNPFYGGYGGVKTQFLIKASELTALGMTAGNINSLALNLTTAGSTLTNLGISIGSTSLTALTSNIETGLSSVYTTSSFVPTVGSNTFNFSTPYSWNGTSNIIVSFCWSNANTSNTVSTVSVDAPGFTSSNARYVDSVVAADVCSYTGSTTPSGWNGASTTGTSRPKMVFGYSTVQATSMTWSPTTELYTNAAATTPYTGGAATVVYTKPSTSRTYTATASNGSCTTSATTNVNPTPAPDFTLTSDVAICKGNATTLTAETNTFTYAWSPSIGLNGTTTASVTASPTTTTTYTVNVTDTMTGCSAPKSVTVSVSEPGAINSVGTTTSQITVPGGTTTFTVATASGATYSYQWQVNDGSGWANLSEDSYYSGVNTATLTLSNIEASFDQYQYQCLVTGASPCATLTPIVATLTVSNTGIATQPQSVTVCDPSSTSFTIVTNGDEPYGIQWQMSIDGGATYNDIAEGTDATTGMTFSGVDTTTLSVSDITLANNGVKFICVLNYYLNSDAATLTVKQPVSITSNPTDQTVCSTGGYASFTATATGDDLAYQWQVSTNGTSWSNYTGTGATTASISVVNPAVSANGTQYRVVVSGNAACSSATSSAATLYINNPTITTAPTAASVLRGNTATFTVAASAATSYQWQRAATLNGTYTDVADATPAGVTYSNATSATLSVVTSATTATGTANYYRCVVTNNGCTVTSTGAGMTVNWYCTPAPTSVDGTGITNVTMGSINNTTGAEPGRYGDYTAQSTTTTQLSTVDFSIRYATGYTYGTKIWIDFNDNGVFTDSGEQVYYGLSTATNPTTLSGSFAVPLTAPLGSHRMRIGGSDNDSGVDPCYASSYAAFEDYSIVITPAPTCEGTPTAGTAASSVSYVCLGSGTNVSTTGATSGVLGISYQWYSSMNGTDFTAISGATSSSIATGALTQGTYYYSTITCSTSGLSANTNTVFVDVYNPLITGTTPAGRCGTGTATLGATANDNATINWYAASTGGASLGTGTSFTTPSISATTTYYVEAFRGGSQQNLGNQDTAAWSEANFYTTSSTDAGIVFTTLLPNITIKGANAYVTGTGSLTYTLKNPSGTTIATYTQNVTNATSSTAVHVDLPSSFTTGAAAAGYSLILTKTGVTWYYFTGSYPYTSSALNITSGWGWGATTTDVRGIHNIDFIAGCTSSRTAVTATVDALPIATISYAGSPFCSTATTGAVTRTGTTGGTYSAGAGLAIDASNGTINVAASTPGSYTVTYAMNGTTYCSAQTATTTVVINQALTSDFGYDAPTYCTNGGTVTPSVTGTAGTFTASPAGLSINASTGVITLASSTEGTYTVTNTVSVAGCSNSVSTTTVTINKAVVITTQPVGASQLIGDNTSFSVAATGTGLSYQWQVSTNGTSWSDISGETGTTLSITAVTADMNGYQYRVVVSGATACSSVTSDVAILTVNTAAITTQPANYIACNEGANSASFSIATVGVVDTYQWQVSTNGTSWSDISNDAMYANANTASLSVSGLSLSNDGWKFRCVVNGVVYSNAGVLSVKTAVAITTQPTASTGCDAGSASFSVVATGSELSYQWQVSTNGTSWSNVTGATAATLTLNSLTVAMNGYQYQVVVSGASPCSAVTSTPAILNVNTAVAITTQPANTTACAGSNAIFTVSANGTSPTYQWQVKTTGGSWTDIAGETGASLTLASVTTAISGNKYRVVVSGAAPCGSVTSSNATLTVSQPAAPTFASSTVNVCPGSVATLTVTNPLTVTNQLGTGTTTTSSMGVTPFGSYYEGAREQYLVRASELIALGYSAGNITSLAFNVTSAGSYAQSNFSIKLGSTTSNSISAFATPVGGYTTVYSIASLATPATGWKTFSFSTPYAWDGTSNILVDVCHDNDTNSTCSSCYGTSSTVEYTSTSFNSVYGTYGDNVQSCGTTSTSTTSVTTRPNMKFSIQAGTTTWLPTTGLYTDPSATTAYTGGNAVTVYTNTTTSTTYTASNVNTLGCANTSNVEVNVLAPATLTGVTQPAITCSGAQTTFALTGMLANSTSTISYTVNGGATQTVSGVVADANGNGTFTIALAGFTNGQTLAITAIQRTDITPNCTTAITANNTVTIAVRSLVTYYADADGDGFGNYSLPTITCQGQPTGYVLNGTDCNDADATMNTTYSFYADTDADGYGAGSAVTLCAVDASTAPSGYAVNGTDCNDSNSSVYQSGSLYIDADADGYNVGTETVCYGATVPTGYSLSTNGTDCNDADASMHATYSFYADTDADGYGAGSAVTLCAVDASTAPSGYAVNGTDCNDSNSSVYQSGSLYIDADADGYNVGTETVCYGATVPTGYSLSTNGTDCNDSDATVHTPITYYVDADGDGYGSTTTGSFCSLTAPTGYSVNNTDCDDSNESIHVGAMYYVDTDADGYDNGTATFCLTSAPRGYSA